MIFCTVFECILHSFEFDELINVGHYIMNSAVHSKDFFIEFLTAFRTRQAFDIFMES